MLKAVHLAVLSGLFATPLAAADLALIVGNEDYRQGPDNRRGDEVMDAAEALEQAGVEVIGVRNGDLGETQEALRRFVQAAPNADSLLVVLSGRFVSTGMDAYMLPVDAEVGSLADLPAGTLPLSVPLAVLAEAPGRAFLVLATESNGEDAADGDLLQPGYGTPELPQGVTLVTALPRGARDLLQGVIAVPGEDLSEGLEIDGSEIAGFLPDGHAFLTGDRAEEGESEAEAWDAALEDDTADGYADYLAAFPDGANAGEAQRRLEAIRNDADAAAPEESTAEETEAALGLDRDERQQIQRDLALLGYDTRGIDGIFGPGTRGAVSAWQEAEGLEATGYLTADQIDRLARAAVARAEVLEREAAQRQAERTRADRALWEETGAAESEEGYRRYLDQFPDGIYAEVARERLAAIEAERTAEADATERQAWEEARGTDTFDAYRTYLDRYPDGAFAEEARAAVEQASAARAEAEAAQAVERALGLNPLTARAVEERLSALGLEPGPVDGTIDGQTRRAIRRYQSDRNLPVTGYLNQPTVVQLLADSFRQFFD